jgi:hypothetical protein
MSCRLSRFRNISTKRSSCDGERNQRGSSRLYSISLTNTHHSSSMNEDSRSIALTQGRSLSMNRFRAKDLSVTVKIDD